MKKIILIVSIIVVLLVVFFIYSNNKNKQQNQQAQQVDNSVTSSSGLFGYLSTLWQNYQANKDSYTLAEAVELSKEIANLKETGKTDDEQRATELILDLNNKGYQYIGYGEVKEIVK